ncbi:MAG: 6-bladed beta-propeller [bacterium]|nr:6-bladed beta-propeller [bacterium]
MLCPRLHHRQINLFALLPLIGAVYFGLSLSPGAALATQPERTEETGGLRHIVNTSNPTLPPKTIEMEELWRVGGDSEAEGEFFGQIIQMVCDESGNLFVLDSQLNNVRIFDSGGAYLRTIGREGEGPGEFRGARGLVMLPDGNLGVIQMMPGKVIGLKPDGDPAPNLQIPIPENAGFIMLFFGQSRGEFTDLVLTTQDRIEGGMSQTRALHRFDADGSILASYTSNTRDINFAQVVVDESIWDCFENRWTLASDGTVYTAETWGEYDISVWNADGTRRMNILRTYRNLKRSREEYEELYDFYVAGTANMPGAEIKLHDFHNPIRSLHARDDGKLWVNHSRGSSDLAEDEIGTFDVFDAEGEYEQAVKLLGDGNAADDYLYFTRDRLYVVSGSLPVPGQESAEEPEMMPLTIICYRLPL